MSSPRASTPRRRRPPFARAACAASLALSLPGAAFGRSSGDWDPSQLARRVTTFRLDNGMRFVVLERHDTPVFSFRTLVDAGSVDEAAGQTGLAHMFEHMAFKGTPEIGSRDYGKEEKAIARLDALYMQLYAERAKGAAADSARLRDLRAQIAAADSAADAWVEPNEFGRIVDGAGGVGLNASTESDITYYYYSLPSNQLELWAYLESERFLRPVFRQFYKERDVVVEERRMSVDSAPVGQFFEEMLGVAFRAHPYKSLGIGHRSDLDNLRLTDARQFYQTYYTPQNMVVAVVGDVYPADVERLAKKYFGRIERRADSPPVHTVEPPQNGERRFVLRGDTQPIFGIAFHRPVEVHADDAALAVLASILGEGRTSRLHTRLVKRDKSALATGTLDGFPGEKYPSLFFVFAIPNAGHTPEEMEKVTFEEIARLKKDLVSEAELARVKTQTRADFIRGLASNSGLASQLAAFEVRRGGWAKLFEEVARLDAVTRELVRDAARTYLALDNATVGTMVTEAPPSEGASAP